ncbi:ABC transporter permease [Streptomyces sp. NEAU-H22]|uniref:FtsX-like permease family protein n=1 Tax=Streptomyces sp. NEAU-H22 TaxID=2994655 RepID=UPI00225B2FDB|nr:FtsX-like permease family protein [Streptomyces sp. NEAU-H22]MCX3290371.1 ABC transporter permease [Streptomyces sp. NEAU-H22]
MRSPVFPLTWHLAHRSGRRGLQSQLIAAATAAVGALVLLVMLAAAFGSGSRAERTSWRAPLAAPAGQATAVQAMTTTYVRHQPLTVVNLAQLPGRHPTPAPPGLHGFPKKGEVYLSPALAELVHTLPGGQLAARFPKPASYGTIGAAGLASPDELVAVIGRAPTDPTVSKAAEDGDVFDTGLTERATVAGFTGSRPSLLTSSDQQTVLLGAVLLVMPVLVLVSAAGRLGAAQREQRLAALRLAGATPSQIIAMTAVEATAVGAAGALTGALAYGALVPALAQVPYGIGGWYADDLWVGVPWLLAVVATVTTLITASAIAMLRQVASSPLGVAQQAAPRRTRMVRLVLFAAALGYILVTTQAGEGLTARQLVTLLLLFYGAYWMFGPWVVDRLGRIAGRFARRPATLLAARRLSDDPRGAWRTVSGLVLAGFVAGFFSVGALAFDTSGHQDQVAIATSDTTSARHTAEAARALLRQAGVTARVTAVSDDASDNLLFGTPGVIAEVPGGPERLDAAVTALASVAPGTYPLTQDYLSAQDVAVVDRITSVSTATLVLSFFVAAASAGLTAAANVLDRRRVYGLLRLAGTPLKVLDRARIRETAIPLAVLAGGTIAAGVYGAYQLNELVGASFNTAGAVELAVCTVVGTLAMFTAIGGSRPLLRRVTAGLEQSTD